VAIDVDFNPVTFRDARELLTKGPDVMIVHFVTPDHQAHAHSVPSRRYAEHIRGFDRDLFEFFAELGPEWTLLVAGDHGAADSGTHGADTPIQRRTVVFAQGPGIARGVRSDSPIDQADLAGTIAALLGLELPAHSRGHVLTEWLDVSPAERARIACADARRAADLASALGYQDVALRAGTLAAGCVEDPSALGRARSAVTLVDAAIESQSGLGSPWVPALALLALALGVLTARLTLPDAPSAALAVSVAVGLGGVALTWGVERLPGGAPNATRVVLFTLGNVPALVALLWPGRFGAWLDRRPALAPALVPGLLLATYTTNAQPESFVALAVSAVLIVLLGGFDATRPTLRASRRVLASPHLALIAAATAVLYLAGTRTSELYPAWIRRDPRVVLGLAGSAMALAVAVLTARSTERRRYAIGAVFMGITLGALLMRRVVPPWPGRLALLLALGASALALLRGRRLLALLSGLLGYAWISRDAELIAVVATLLLADGAGAALARHRVATGRGAEPLSLSQTLLVTTFLFGMAFVQRIGIQGAIDFGAMDWGAAAFGDPHVSAWIVGGALGMKYALALWLVIGAFTSELGPRAAESVLQAVFVAFSARATVLALMFLTSGASFWTGLRVLGDLPFAMLWTVGAGLAWLASRYFSARSSSS
jgi:hypothetical protein